MYRVIIIGKQNCPYTRKAKKIAKIIKNKQKIIQYTYYNVTSRTGQFILHKYRNRIPNSHSTYPIILINSRKKSRYHFLGGCDVFIKWVNSNCS